MKKSNKVNLNTFLNIINLCFILTAIIIGIYGIKIGIFKDIDVLIEEVKKVGPFGPLVFMLIQVVQVVLPIIPGGITLPAGVIIFGPISGFIYNYLSITIGSCINFLLVRKYGPPVVEKFISPETHEKYMKLLEKEDKFELIFALIILLPGFPDDFVCRLAGLSKMSLKKMILILVLCKPWVILVYSLMVERAVGYFN